MAGHSFAGTELTYLGRRYPNRIAALVYIEAAYNYPDMDTDTAWTSAPSIHPPVPEYDDNGVRAWTLYRGRDDGPGYPEAETRATLVFDGK